MKLSSGSKNSQVLLVTALVAALLFAVYYYLVLPKKDEVEMLKSSISSLQMEISTFQEQIAVKESMQTTDTPNLFVLRQKVPQNRDIDQLLLNIGEIEYVTQSRVASINFNNYDSLVSGAGYTEPTLPEEGTEAAVPQDDVENGETTEIGEGAEQEEAAISTIAETLPPELKLITFNLQVESPDYESLLQFIKELEKLERVMHIDTISYSLPGEEDLFAEEFTQVVSASIQVTTFYYEGEQ